MIPHNPPTFIQQQPNNVNQQVNCPPYPQNQFVSRFFSSQQFVALPINAQRIQYLNQQLNTGLNTNLSQPLTPDRSLIQFIPQHLLNVSNDAASIALNTIPNQGLSLIVPNSAFKQDDSTEQIDQTNELILRLKWSERDVINFHLNQFSSSLIKPFSAMDSENLMKSNNSILILLSNLPLKLDGSIEVSAFKKNTKLDEPDVGSDESEPKLDLPWKMRYQLIDHLLLVKNLAIHKADSLTNQMRMKLLKLNNQWVLTLQSLTIVDADNEFNDLRSVETGAQQPQNDARIDADDALDSATDCSQSHENYQTVHVTKDMPQNESTSTDELANEKLKIQIDELVNEQIEIPKTNHSEIPTTNQIELGTNNYVSLNSASTAADTSISLSSNTTTEDSKIETSSQSKETNQEKVSDAENLKPIEKEQEATIDDNIPQATIDNTIQQAFIDDETQQTPFVDNQKLVNSSNQLAINGLQNNQLQDDLERIVHTIKINNFDDFSATASRINSKVFYFHGIGWYISFKNRDVYSKTNRRNYKYLDFNFQAINLEKQFPLSLEVRLLSQDSKFENQVRFYKFTFKKNNTLNCANFISYERLSANSPFVRNNTIFFQICVRAIKQN